MKAWNGADFKLWRTRLRLTQEDAGFVLGVNRRTVMAWEASESNPISRTVMLACLYASEHPEITFPDDNGNWPIARGRNGQDDGGSGS